MRKPRVTAPKTLSPEARRLWHGLTDGYSIRDPGGLVILQTCLEAFDRMRSAQAKIAADGETFKDRFGQIKTHPMLVVERDARSAMLQALKQLNLDVEPLGNRNLGRS